MEKGQGGGREDVIQKAGREQGEVKEEVAQGNIYREKEKVRGKEVQEEMERKENGLR